jgi:MFS family permease
VLAKESFPPDRAGSVLGLSNMTSSIAAAALGAAAGLALDAGWRGLYEHGIRVYPVEAYAAIPAVLLVGSSMALLGGLLVRETYARQVEVPQR